MNNFTEQTVVDLYYQGEINEFLMYELDYCQVAGPTPKTISSDEENVESDKEAKVNLQQIVPFVKADDILPISYKKRGPRRLNRVDDEESVVTCRIVKKCKICRLRGHNARTCQRRWGNSG
jgi:hypothetical protein